MSESTAITEFSRAERSTAQHSRSRAKSRTQRIVIAVIGAASLSVLSMTAVAELPPQERVGFGDLNLTQKRDTQLLYQRLRTAASEVCSDFGLHKGQKMRQRRLECEAKALGDAVAKINHPALNELYAAKTGVKFAQGKTKPTPSG